MGHSPGLAIYLAYAERVAKKPDQNRSEQIELLTVDRDGFGSSSKKHVQTRPDGRVIWFHATNIGDSLSILELVRRLGDRREDLHFLITTGSITSTALVAARMPDQSIHQYIPTEERPKIRAFLKHWKPDLAVWAESELRPALMFETDVAKIPMLLINAKLTDELHRKWRWFPGVAKSLLRRFKFVLAQDDLTSKFLRRLGLPADRIEVVGALKEGSAALPHDEAERMMFANQLAGRPVWLAASTHPGEEAVIVGAHRQAARAAQRLLLIIAPDDYRRAVELAKKLKKDGWEIALRSEGEFPEASTQIYLADTPGEMGMWYRIAPVTFMGGSLVDYGGHNPFEPAALGSAIIHGPHVHRVADIYQRLWKVNATVKVKSGQDLIAALGKVLSPDKAAEMAHAAWEVSSSGAEVTDRALDLLAEYLPAAEEGSE